MKRTNSEHSNEMELSDADLALVQGGARVPANVSDPVPQLDEATVQKLHDLLNNRYVRGV